MQEEGPKVRIGLGEMPERENRKAVDSKIRKPMPQDVGMNKAGRCKSIERAALPVLRLESRLKW